MVINQAGLLLRGRHVPLFSGEMHFWRIGRDWWAACLRQIKAAGLPMVSTYLSWRRHSPEPEEYDLTGRIDPRLDLPAFLRLCASIGLWVHLKPGPWICAEEPNGGYPDWLVADPDLQVLDGEGRPVPGYNPPFQSPIPSYLHPKYLDHVRRWLTEVDTCIRDFCYPQGPILMIQLDNEPSMTFHDRIFEADYNPVNVGDEGLYQRWLRDKYGAIEVLNSAHRSAWEEFRAIEAPRSLSLQSLAELRRYADWVEFKESLLARYIESLREIHLQNGLRNILFTVNYNKHHPMAVPNNWNRLEQASGLGGFDYYVVPPLEFGDLVDVALAVEYSLAVTKVAWAPEMMAGIWKIPEVEEDQPAPEPEDLEYLYFLGLAFGLKGMNYYMMVNREKWESAPVNEEGQPTQTFRAPLRAMEFIRHVPDFAGLRKVQQVAIMYYRPYAWEAHIADGHNVKVEGHNLGQPYHTFRDLYTALIRLNCNPGIVDPWANPDRITQFRLVFVPSGTYMDRTVQELLVDYATSGGNVVFCPGPPQFDLDLIPCSLFDAFAAKTARPQADAIPAQRKIGKGMAVRLESISADDSAREIKPTLESLQMILKQFDLMPGVQTGDPNVMTVVHRNDATEVLFLINANTQTARPRLHFKAVQSGKLVEVLSGETHSTIQNGEACVARPGRSIGVFLVHKP